MDLIIEILVEMTGDICILRPQGDLDSSNSSSLKKQMLEQLQKGRYRIIMDLEKVPLIDSTALEVLVAGMKVCMQNNGSIILVNPCEEVKNLLEIIHFDRVFSILPDRDEALKVFRKNDCN